MNELLDEIYQYLENPQRYERYIASLCPFHDDYRPSFFVYPDSYRCSACEVRGKTKQLLNDLKNRKFGVSLEKREKTFHSPWALWEGRYGHIDNIIYNAHRNLLDHNKTSYLYKRGITMKTINALKIGWMDDWITFPIFDASEEIISGVARAGETNKSTAKYCLYPNTSPTTLYVPDWKMVQCHSKMYLVYGIIDAVTLYQLGYAAASTVTGKRVDPSAFDTIRKKIIILPDDGEELDATWLASRLGWRGDVMTIDYPAGTKDCNDLLVKQKDHLISVLEKTQ